MVPSSSPHADPHPEPDGPAAEHADSVRRALVALRNELEEARSSLDRLEGALAQRIPEQLVADPRAASCASAHGSDTPLTGP